MQRVFVGRETGVMAIDVATRKVIPTLLKGRGIASILLLPDRATAVATERAIDTVTFFDRSSGQVIAQTHAGKEPDGALFDPHSGFVFVFNSVSHDATVIRLSDHAVAATIPVGGIPEASVSDGNGLVYVNIVDRSEIAVIESNTRQVVRRFMLPGCIEPTGLAFDPQTQVLISSCQNGIAQLTYAGTGGEVGQVPIGRRPDDAIFDAKHRIAYIPCGDGTLTVFRLTKDRTAEEITVASTQEAARTAALDESNGRVYLPAVHVIYGTDGKRHRVDGTFVVLVAAPLPDSE